MQRKTETLSAVQSFLASRRALNVFLLVVYFGCVAHFHVEVGGFINGLFSNVSRTGYNNFVISVALISLGTLIYVILSDRKKILERDSLVTIALLNLVSIIYCFCILFVINIEAIHFVQYALFAFLCLPIVKSNSRVILIATIAGAMDELWQYLVLDTRAMYFDFNDVLLDTIGAGLGLVLMKMFGVVSGSSPTLWYRRIEVISSVIIFIVLVGMWIGGSFSIQPTSEGALSFFTLFKEVPEGFWMVPAGPYARFHILRPIPGLILIAISCFIYGRLDRVEPMLS